MINEQIKAELDCQKIDEPDTPFNRSPLREDESDEEAEPASVSLETDFAAMAKVTSLLEGRQHAEGKGGVTLSIDTTSEPSPKPRFEMPTTILEDEPICLAQDNASLSSSLMPNLAEATHFKHPGYDSRRMSNGEPQDLPDLFAENLLQSRSEFEQKRKHHYKMDMRDALRRSKQLMEEEDEDDDNEEELDGHL